MDQRERLIELMIEAKKAEPDDVPFSDFLADFLLSNGVIVPPCKVGDTVYAIAQPCGGCKAYNDVITEEYIKTCRRCDMYEIVELSFDYDLIPEWGKTVFPTKEQAEKALAERIGNE